MKPTVKSIQTWSPDSTDELKGCFETTDWDTFFHDEDCLNDHDRLMDTINDYIVFCVDSIIKTKELKIFPNNKPWINKELKHSEFKENSFQAGGQTQIQRARQGG